MTLDPNGPSKSFLPEDYVRGKDEARWNIISLLLFGVVMIAVVSAFILTNRRWQNVRVEQESIRTQFEEEAIKIAALEDLEKQRVEMTEKASIVAALRDRVPRSLLMAELWRAKPEDATLTEIELEGERIAPPKPEPSKGGTSSAVASLRGNKGQAPEAAPQEKAPVAPPQFRHSLLIEGVADENDQVADYLANLKESPLLKDVELQFITETVLENRQMRKFRITATLDPEARAQDVEEAEETTLFNETASGGEAGSIGAFLSGLTGDKGGEE
jgi:Tfp pilus assembly protein PilN